MEKPTVNPDSIIIPRWTIKRDTRSIGCIFCRSIIVRVTTDSRQMAFCCCRVVDYRILPGAHSRITDGRSR
jgi:hypothetical protein